MSVHKLTKNGTDNGLSGMTGFCTLMYISKTKPKLSFKHMTDRIIGKWFTNQATNTVSEWADIHVHVKLHTQSKENYICVST